MLRIFLFVLMALVMAACEKSPSKPKQKTTVTLLPDVPPPPPPPPPKELPPPPKDAPKEVKMEQPKEAPPQQAEALKMDGPAGDAPSAFAAGAVTGDYTGQQLGEKTGPSLGGVDRMVFETYKTRLQRLLQEELVKVKELKGADYRIPARIRRDGTQWVVSMADSTGDPKVDEMLRMAVARAIERETPPASAPAKGFDVRVSNKLLN